VKIAAMNIDAWCGTERNRFSQCDMPVLLLISNIKRCVQRLDAAKFSITVHCNSVNM